MAAIGWVFEGLIYVPFFRPLPPYLRCWWLRVSRTALGSILINAPEDGNEDLG